MSCNSSGYMDGVPVKISERYKPPPRITLPQNIFQRVNLIRDDLTTANCDTSFERNVINKIKEWRLTKEKECLERSSRLNKAREAEQQYLAVENEERRKQLTEVSYPSTDDLSELSNEVDRTNNFNYSTNNHSSILQPQLTNNITVNSPIGSHYKINYSDFENDTSSPFDNMELKTINDIELLAQVLSNSQIKQQTTDQYSTTNTDNYVGDGKITNKVTNGYYNSNYQYNYQFNNTYQQQQQPVEFNYPVQYDTSYLSSNKVFNQYSANTHDNTPQTPLPGPSYSHRRSKSRSVPDIVQELENELSQAKEVVLSKSPVPVIKTSPDFSRNTKQNRAKSISESKSVPNETLENPYKSLSPQTQKIAFHISQMGFPLARTARACLAVGDNDKKIIEYLLAMDQLMDLGFTESKVSEALLKFNNDRDKALDYLIT